MIGTDSEELKSPSG